MSEKLQKARETFCCDPHSCLGQIKYKYSHHLAEVHFQGNAEKGQLVGSLQLSLRFLCSLLPKAIICQTVFKNNLKMF